MHIEANYTTDEGFIAVVLLTTGGYRCGYVGVPTDHFAAKGIAEQNYDIKVHGGITFSGSGDHPIPVADTYWYGFDAAHNGDSMDIPAMDAAGMKRPGYISISPEDVVRTFDYMKSECDSLSQQLSSPELFI